MNQLNKLTFQTTDSHCADIEPVQPGSQPEMNTTSSQFLWHLLTIAMIIAALAFPYYILGDGDGWLSQFNLFNKGAIADASGEKDGGKAVEGASLAADIDSGDTTSLAETTDPDSAATTDTDSAAKADSGTITSLDPVAINDDLDPGAIVIPDTTEEANDQPGAMNSLTASTAQGAVADADSVVVPTSNADSETAAGEATDSAGPVYGTKHPWIPVDSSDIVAVRHNPKSNQLDIEFNGGRIYQYSDVPKKVYDGLMKADSHGKFFARKIKDAGYEVKKLK